MKHIVSAAVITNPKGEYLLQYRDADAPAAPNEWGLFGGHREGDESSLETLVRELKEEIGLSFAPERFNYIDTVSYPDVEISIYRLFLKDGEGERIHLQEGGAFRFFGSQQEIGGLDMAPRIRELLKKYLVP